MNESTLKLNLGSGQHKLPGYLNVDKFGDPDLKCDLESFPWPWPDNSVDEIVLHHVLEHLGETSQAYLRIMKEMYRVCKTDATVSITVPHPRHDDFINDPTHVRAVTPDSLAVFSKSINRVWIEGGAVNSPLGIYLDIDFEIKTVNFSLDESWASRVQSGEIQQSELPQLSRQYNNVIREVRIDLRVVK